MIGAVLCAGVLNVNAAETYPARPVRLIIPAGAGGVTDILGRVVTSKLTDSMGQQVIVDNRPGASGIVGSQIVAKAKPGQLNHGSVGSGSMGALGAELLRTLAGIQFQQVSYKGSPQALTALVAGEIDFYLIGSAGTVVPQVKAGRVRAIGVGAKQRIAVLPDVPSISESVPGYEARGWNGILAPAGTPKAIVDRLHAEIVKVVKSPEFDKVVTNEGATAVGNTPAEFDRIIRADLAKWAKIVKDNNIRAQ